MKPKAIIFDLWETLGTKNVAVSRLLKEKFSIPKADDYLQKYEEAVQLDQWNTEEEMARNFLLKFQINQTPENIEFVITVFKEAIIKATLFDGMRDLLISLKEKGLKIGLLSNTTIFESVVLENLEIRNLFDAIVFSWHKGALKPSEEAFKHILDELAVSASEAIFIDDTEKNVVAAGKQGIPAIQFKSVSELNAKLYELGIL
jgi:HAD superfamily hydrolase (TIGR01509 family)